MKKNKIGKKNYTNEEKYDYHLERIQSDKATANQKAYSRNWLDGFTDSHASKNLVSVKNDLKYRKEDADRLKNDISQNKQMLKDINVANNTVFGAFINGLKAQLKK